MNAVRHKGVALEALSVPPRRWEPSSPVRLPSCGDRPGISVMTKKPKTVYATAGQKDARRGVREISAKHLFHRIKDGRRLTLAEWDLAEQLLWAGHGRHVVSKFTQ